jgi:hypothetical protein
MEGLGVRRQRYGPDDLRGHMHLLERESFQGHVPAYAERAANQGTSQRTKQDAVPGEFCFHENDDETCSAKSQCGNWNDKERTTSELCSESAMALGAPIGRRAPSKATVKARDRRMPAYRTYTG